MANPRKRKGGRVIADVLNKGGTASESDFTQAQIENLLEIGYFGHDGGGGFNQGKVGSLRKDGQGSLAEDAGLETVAALDARMGGTANWNTVMSRYYLTNDTTAPGMSLATKADVDSGILHCPAGPDAKTVPKLEDVSNGSAIDFFLKPANWGSGGRSLRIYIENTDANTNINFRNGDDDSSIGNQNGVKAAGTYMDIDEAAANNGNGIKIRVTSTGTGTTALAGWHIAWENRPA